MATNARNDYTAAAAQDTFSITFEFDALDTTEILVYKDFILQVEGVAANEYAVSGTNIVFNTPLAGGEYVKLKRQTDLTPVVDFNAKSIVDNNDIQEMYVQTLRLAQEERQEDSRELYDSTEEAIADENAKFWDEASLSWTVKNPVTGWDTKAVPTTSDKILIADAADSDSLKEITVASLALTVDASVVVGPASAVDDNLAAFDGTTGKLVKDSGIAAGDKTLGHILVADGTGMNSVLMSGDAAIDAAGVVTVTSASSDKVILAARVNEAAGVVAGDLVYLTGATGSVPQVALADNTDFTKVAVLAMCNEAGADNAFIDVVMLGLVDGLDTSSFAEGVTLYLATAGQFTDIHPTGIDAVVEVGKVVRVHASMGSIAFVVESRTIAETFDGVMRDQIVNCSTGTSAVVSSTYVNDQGQRGSISLSGSLHAFSPSMMNWYNQGYGDSNFLNDGNVDFTWYSDVGDNHDASNLSFIMTLTAAGDFTTGEASTATRTLARAGDVGKQVIGGGGNGGELHLWGENNAAQGKDFQLKSGGGTKLSYDASLDTLAFTGGTVKFNNIPLVMSVLSQEQTVDVTNRSTTSTSMVASGVQVTVDPITTGSKIRVQVTGIRGHSAAGLQYFTLYRNVDGGGDVALTPGGVNDMASYDMVGSFTSNGLTIDFIDDHGGTTGEDVIYKLYWKVNSGTGYLGRRGSSTDLDSPTIITATEIL